ncbi:hypothetical protein WMF18_37310 [Sorangium sp. So ce315]|uniref:hypothetical protein n=1 Tax=Sorangium sp. So ce315 TaxID=3133299 RepID=UPI003F5FA278
MRGSTSSLVFVFCVAAGAALSACSGETTENPGGGGGSGGDGGAGTTSSTTSTTSTSAATTSAATTSSGAGGDGGSAGNGTVCDQACDKAEECTVPVCNILNFDCTDPAAECSAQCVLDASCEQIQSITSDAVDPELAGCLSECQGTEGGGSGVQCLSCAGQNGCLTACALNNTCRPWLECARVCMESDPQPQCFSDCDAAHPDAAELAEAVYSCTCTDCSESCGAVVDPCN